MSAFFSRAAVFAGPSHTLDRIRADGVIHLGYRAGAAPFSFKERDGKVRGYSVELCTRIASAIQKQLGLATLKVEWTALEAGTRIDSVAKGKVDIECGTTTMSLARYERVDFSLPIFVDGGSVLTRTDAKLNQFADLAGKRVGVIPGTTTETGAQTRVRRDQRQGRSCSRQRRRGGAGPAARRKGRRLRGRSHRPRLPARRQRRSLRSSHCSSAISRSSRMPWCCRATIRTFASR